MPARSQTQSHVRFPLNAIFGSGGNVRVLRALALHAVPQQPLSVTDISKLGGLTTQGVRMVLSALVEQRLVGVHGTDRSTLYYLHQGHPFAAALIGLFTAEAQRFQQLLETIRGVLTEQGSAVRAAWLYGSVARGEDGSQSDLDIALLVTSSKLGDVLRERLMPIEDAQQVHISLTALTPKELAALPDDDRWWSDVVRDARVLQGAAPLSAKRQVSKSAS